MAIKPKVSVIIPNFNHARFLEQRIESVISQEFSDLEIIILDDFSNDNSVEILKKYEMHPFIRHIVLNKKNSGSTFVQWVKGFKLAQSEYIWIAESDDFSSASFLKEMLASIEEDKNIAVAYCPSHWVDEKGNVILESSTIERAVFKGDEFIRQNFTTGNAIPNASMAIFRKESLDRVDFSALMDFKYCGDWLFWVSLINQSFVYQHDKPLNYYRRHTSSVSSSSEKDGLFFTEGLKVIVEIKKKIKLTYFERILIYKKWGYKLFLHLKKPKIKRSKILLSFLSKMPISLLFCFLYYIKYSWKKLEY